MAGDEERERNDKRVLFRDRGGQNAREGDGVEGREVHHQIERVRGESEARKAEETERASVYAIPDNQAQPVDGHVQASGADRDHVRAHSRLHSSRPGLSRPRGG